MEKHEKIAFARLEALKRRSSPWVIAFIVLMVMLMLILMSGVVKLPG